jgi:CheY-like chemotaxis protein
MSGLALEGVPVLVVDDDPASAKLLAVVLRADGCQTQVAYSAEDALKTLATFRPRAIVMDVILPLMSGLLLTQLIKADPATRDIVVIAVSAFNGIQAERAARAAGCVAFLQKPINPLTFGRLVLEHLAARS